MMFDVERGLADIRDWAGKMADYPVEVGEKGIWTYRKWASGIAECWMSWEGTVTRYTTSMLPTCAPMGFYHTWNLPFPFTKRYTKTATVQVASGIGVVCSGGLGDSLTKVSLHWASNATGLSTVNMYIIGLYKPLETVGGGVVHKLKAGLRRLVRRWCHA